MDAKGYISPTALIGSPPEHRDYRWRSLTDVYLSGAFHYPMIDDTAIIEAFVTIDAGLERPTRVMDDTLVMKHAHVGHDAQIGAHCDLAPGCLIGGHVQVGDGTKIGMGAMIRPRVKIGSNCVIGMGAVVVKDVPAGQKWAGNPAGPLHTYVPHVDRDLWEEWWEEWHPAGGTDAWPVARSG